MTPPCTSRSTFRKTNPPKGALPHRTPDRPGPRARLAGALGLAALLAGCATSTAKSGSPRPAHSGQASAVTFAQPVAAVRQVAHDALQSLDCTLRSETDSRLVGKFQSGEIVTIALEEAGPNQTRVEITSQRTFVGGAWQTDRRADTLWAINRLMRQTTAP